MIDKIISEIDFALKLFSVPPKGVRKNPADKISKKSQVDDSETIRFMRVNHSGEICAQGLYRGQLFFNNNSKISSALEKAAYEEIDHLNWCDERLKELNGKTSRLNPFLYIGSIAFGAMASKIDSKLNLGFLEETEKQVSAHLESHLKKIPKTDKKTHAILQQMQLDEKKHEKTANQLGSKPLPKLLRSMMTISSKAMTKSTYWI
jgi:ubiquinone biosynthesis monooxygenase Coq7